MNKRIINTNLIQTTIVKLIYQASFIMPDRLKSRFTELRDKETSDLARNAIDILLENAEIALNDKLPLCQDCGMTIIFIEIGQDVSLEGVYLEEAVNNGVQEAYNRYFLRKSIVSDPLQRKNTGTNTPCTLHIDIIEGTNINITVYLKGGGSENMTALKLFNPTDPLEKIIEFIENTIIQAGPNPCPPLFLGIGIGGTADTAVLNAKKAVLRNPDLKHPDPFYSNLETTIKQRLNNTNIGPLGFGGESTVAEVFIKEAPCHIASLPVALNLNCHSLRYASEEI